jgi:glyoxylase-like metal-dependent hydrolase (beta-lactamase superfamily II)
MIEVKRFTNQQFTSNVYTMTSSFEREEVILIDCGEFDDVIESLHKTAKIKSVFITHYHYDHIYYIQKYIDEFPNVKFYSSQETFEGLSNSKRNLSSYHDYPIEIKEINFEVLCDGQYLPIFENSDLHIIETEGYCEGSLTYLIDNFVFTGDALIPNISIVTKLRTGNKLKAKESVEKIKHLVNSQSLICAGHLETMEYNNVDWNLYLND